MPATPCRIGGKLTIETANVTLDADYARFHAPVKPGDYVMLAISDTGIGMDADTQAHIFEPFYTTKGLKGTGLGLSTVYGIVKQSDGYIWLYSEAGKGTTFKIYLPRFSATGEVLATQPRACRSAGRAAATKPFCLSRTKKICAVWPASFLKTRDTALSTLPTAQPPSRFPRHHQGPIHLLLTDVIMPGMNGRELANNFLLLAPR